MLSAMLVSFNILIIVSKNLSQNPQLINFYH